MYSCSVNVREMKKMDALIYEMYKISTCVVASLMLLLCQLLSSLFKTQICIEILENDPWEYLLLSLSKISIFKR